MARCSSVGRELRGFFDLLILRLFGRSIFWCISNRGVLVVAENSTWGQWVGAGREGGRCGVGVNLNSVKLELASGEYVSN